ncbi:MAG TPA: immunity 49 family protein [Burkholderiales bacterium]|nr:immunity 49 family protein [Burkholderiales bacterium]
MTITVPAHPFQHDILSEKTDNTRAFLERVQAMIPERPDLLGPYSRRAVEYAAGIYALPLKENGVEWIGRSARAGALLFANRMHGDEGCAIQLDAKTILRVTTPGDTSEAHAPAWIRTMWSALASNDPIAQNWLAAVDEGALQAEGIRYNAYQLPYMRFLRALVLQDGTHEWQLEEAIEGCDADALEVPEALDEMDHFDYPALKACFHLLDGDSQGFENALKDVLQSHKRYWSRKEFAMAVQGLISVPACALRRLAVARGLNINLSSPYMPEAVWQAAPPSMLECCPYCVIPKPPEAPHCGLCGLDTLRDAPLDIATVQYRSDIRKVCSQCDFRMHELATQCPRCRTKQ